MHPIQARSKSGGKNIYGAFIIRLISIPYLIAKAIPGECVLPLDINVTSWFILRNEVKVYPIKQFAKLAGVSVRTLHYYDEIGLLKPSWVGENGYRHYDEEALLRLQQILFYRELDLSLDEIKAVVGRRDFDVLIALGSHKKALQGRVERLKRLIQTVDNTIDQLKGNGTMNIKGLFEGFSEEEQEKHALEAEQMYDPEIVRVSNRKWKAYPPAEKELILAEGKAIYADLVTAMPKGAGSEEVQALIARWHRHLQYFWSPNDEQLLGLADLYNDDPRFRANYDKMDPKLAGFMRKAVKVYVERRT
jgi:MerR family transcriptional regulator, thiopeptide resistance regulator